MTQIGPVLARTEIDSVSCKTCRPDLLPKVTLTENEQRTYRVLHMATTAKSAVDERKRHPRRSPPWKGASSKLQPGPALLARCPPPQRLARTRRVSTRSKHKSNEAGNGISCSSWRPRPSTGGRRRMGQVAKV